MKDFSLFLSIIFIGLSATLCIDIYSLYLKRFFNIPSLDYKFVGRWLIYCCRGKFFHHTIMQSPEKAGEKYVGWLAHYLIGILFSYIFIILIGSSWINIPTLLPALIMGIMTVIIPFFIMQPCLGFGWAASRLATPYYARLKSLSTHAVFGVGLYLGACLLQFLLLQSRNLNNFFH
ncbi:DUF2938 domain-containing protein [Acinetobacter puyangensis]|uniref:DUF2938 domain-containing protein n=1 Tax=Acinetobacter puyangensis TaxID=1096779 RepID=UPI003A4D48B0